MRDHPTCVTASAWQKGWSHKGGGEPLYEQIEAGMPSQILWHSVPDLTAAGPTFSAKYLQPG